mmetsp:Transcript_6825/g.22094  ORF Transcript_6825/g.22094 Transcript_6825/m.22094 type:complete len:332 (+) Transcript_6825:350-1345(+)
MASAKTEPMMAAPTSKGDESSEEPRDPAETGDDGAKEGANVGRRVLRVGDGVGDGVGGTSTEAAVGGSEAFVGAGCGAAEGESVVGVDVVGMDFVGAADMGAAVGTNGTMADRLVGTAVGDGAGASVGTAVGTVDGAAVGPAVSTGVGDEMLVDVFVESEAFVESDAFVGDDVFDRDDVFVGMEALVGMDASVDVALAVVAFVDADALVIDAFVAGLWSVAVGIAVGTGDGTAVGSAMGTGDGTGDGETDGDRDGDIVDGAAVSFNALSVRLVRRSARGGASRARAAPSKARHANASDTIATRARDGSARAPRTARCGWRAKSGTSARHRG